MPASEKDFALITHFLRNLRGGSQPILVQASDGLLYVAKFTNNLQGSNVPFNESAGSELYRGCGLRVPSWKPLLLTDSFLDRNPGCWMQDEVGPRRPASGLCFGSRFLGGEQLRLLEVLPRTSLSRVSNRKSFWLAWMVDICAGHADNRQALFLEDPSGWLNAFFVDHGHLFGGPSVNRGHHFLTSRYIDPRIYHGVSSQYILDCQRVAASLDVDRLWREVNALPAEWRTPSALDGFTQCLSRLSTTCLLQGVLDTMVDAQQRTYESERGEYEAGRRLPMRVLCARVHAA
jgi:hypothetical protein